MAVYDPSIDDEDQGPEAQNRKRQNRKRGAEVLKDVASAPSLPFVDATPFGMPLRAAMAGAAGLAEAPDWQPIESVGVVGNVAPQAMSMMETGMEVGADYVGNVAEQAETILFGKQQERQAREGHAATASQNAREDPSAGTAQGGAQPYTGTGDVASRTAESGGVTTGEPGKGSMKVSLPGGGGMVDYDPDDPTVSEAYAQLGGDGFMEHRVRTAPRPPEHITVEKGPKSGSGQGHSWTRSSVPEAAQIRNMNQTERGLEAESQAFLTEMAKSGAEEAGAEARTARANILAAEPFYGEELEAKAKIGEARIEAAGDVAHEQRIMNTIEAAAARINEMRADPKFQALDPAVQQQLIDEVWDQARLAVSGLTETNLYPRPDPYAMFNIPAPKEKEE